MAILNLQDLFGQRQKQQSFEFIFRTQIKDPNSDSFRPAPVVVPVDTTITETYNLTSQITVLPVQSGETITDHIHIQPQSVSIKGIISEAPTAFSTALTQSIIDFGVNQSFNFLAGTTGFRAFANRLSPVLGNIEKYAANFVSGAVSAGILGDTHRKGAQAFFWKNFLEARFLDKKPFQIKSGLTVINNVFFERISFPRTKQIGDSLIFDCSLKEIKFIKSNVIITQQAGGENHKPQSLGNVKINEFRAGALSSQNAAGEVEQTFPKVPRDAITKVKNEITTTTREAKSKVLDFLGSL